MSLFSYSSFPCSLRVYLPSKREITHYCYGHDPKLTLTLPCGNYVKKGHKGKILIKSQKCGSRRFPKERPAQKRKSEHMLGE
jgi:hypothetical protein